MSGRLFPLDGDDWYEWRQKPALPGTVHVRIEAHEDGRLGLAELRVIGQPTSELLRAIPVGRIEATANAQLTLVDANVVPAPSAARRRRRNPDRPRPPHPNDKGWEQSRPAADADSRGRPDSFYADIAAEYQDQTSRSPRPAADLADRHDVPVTTAHRWIKEARRRGLLAPGRPGKAG
jgi:hypothetical protein